MPKVLERCVEHVMDSGKSEDAAWPICIDRLRDKHPSVEKWVHRKKKKSALTNCLVAIANQLDQKGLFEEAAKIDSMIKNAGTWELPSEESQLKILSAFLSKLHRYEGDLLDPSTTLYNVLGDDNLFDNFLDIKKETFDKIRNTIIKYLESLVAQYRKDIRKSFKGDEPVLDKPKNWTSKLDVERLDEIINAYKKQVAQL